MKREEIAALALEVFEKGEAIRALELANTPLDYEQRKQATIAFALAQYDYEWAKSKLAKAIGDAK